MNGHSPSPPPDDSDNDGFDHFVVPKLDYTLATDTVDAPPAEECQLWDEVAEGLDRNATVVWTKAVESLECARRYLQPPPQSTPDAIKNYSCPAARSFADSRMNTIISILLEQQPAKIGPQERECVEKSVRCALTIVRDDLERLAQASHAPDGIDVCSTLPVLHHILHKKKIYYRGAKAQWSSNPAASPDVRNQMISTFKRLRGFTFLGIYLKERALLTQPHSTQQNSHHAHQQQQQQQPPPNLVTTPVFPPLDTLQIILEALKECVPLPYEQQRVNYDNNSANNNNNNNNSNNNNKNLNMKESADEEAKHDILLITTSIMSHLLHLDEETLKRLSPDAIRGITYHLQRIYERLALSDPPAIYDYYAFSRSLVLKLITSSSLPLKLLGWTALEEIIEASGEKRPPPKCYLVKGAGLDFINGIYEFDPKKIGEGGWIRNGVDVSYIRRIPEEEFHDCVDPAAAASAAASSSTSSAVNVVVGGGGGTVVVGGGGAVGGASSATTPTTTTASAIPTEGAGKTLTLFRCTMRSQQKWWFISEADEDQPGTDKDIDYYQHKSKPQEESLPSISGWATCRAGVDPPPTLKPMGLMVPPGEEENTLECVLAKWAIENGVIELVLGDSIHREIVARSTALIKFLASMCKDDSMEGEDGSMVVASSSPMHTEKVPNERYCLKLSHLLLAWKTCTSKTDAAVSAEIYNLLVSILPSLPEDLAVPLIQAIRSEVDKGNHNFFEVSEFGCAIANMSESHSNKNSGGGNSNNNNNAEYPNPISVRSQVREEILSLQWAILTHEDAWTLKSYDAIKKYVSSEIRRVEPVANEMRNRFLLHCREILSRNSGGESSTINETHALYMVQLTRFVLESYPRDRTDAVLVISDGEDERSSSLADLLLMELTAYLNRRRTIPTAPPVRKPSSASVAVPEFNYSRALSERLQILRYVYGLSSTSEMTSQQLDHLWSLCTLPVDREAIMDFLADASNAEIGPLLRPETNKGQMTPGNQLHAVFSNEVSIHVFGNLFCSANVGWECLGEVAFCSFQTLFKSLVHGNMQDSVIKDRAIDALWRICLSAGNENVATNAMTELLSVYSRCDNVSRPNAPNETDGENTLIHSGNLFSKRIFECLFQVKEHLQRGDDSSLRSAERCIKILKRAFNMSTLGGGVHAVADRLLTTCNTAASSELPRNPANELDLNMYLKEIPHGLRGVSSCKTVSVMAKKIGSCDRFTLEIHPLQTLASIKMQVAQRCNHDVQMIKLSNISGRSSNDVRPAQRPNFSAYPDTSIAASLRISEGSELIFALCDKILEPVEVPWSSTTVISGDYALDLSGLLDDEGSDDSFGVFFDTLISVLESLPAARTIDSSEECSAQNASVDSHSLVWDVLMAMPTNVRVSDFVTKAAREWRARESNNSGDAMAIDSSWSSLIDIQHFERSVYVLQVLDFSLRPPPHLFSCLPADTAEILADKMRLTAHEFRTDFIRSGGFEAVLRLFVESGTAEKKTRRRMRMGNEFALRILSNCFFSESAISDGEAKISKEGLEMMKTFPNIGDFLRSLMYIVVDDEGVADAAILRVLRLIEAMLKSGHIFTSGFERLPEKVTEKFLTSLLLWEGSLTSIKSAAQIRKKTEDLILEIPLLSSSALPFLVGALADIDSLTDGSNEFFAVLMKLVAAAKGRPRNDSMDREMEDLGTAVCDKLASYPRPTGDNEHIDYSTGVLCGCLKLLISLIDLMGGSYLQKGSRLLLEKLNNEPWCQGPEKNEESVALINLMGSIFDCFVSSCQSPGSPPICCDKESRQLAFHVVVASAQACHDGDGYGVLVTKISDIMSHVAPAIRHVWGHNVTVDDGNNQRASNTAKYSGLKNQGCTCYMNSVLQQLFMMPMLRKSLCSAEVPTSLRSSGGGAMSEGHALVGKKISLHWDCGNNYDAIVDNFDEKTGMHTISYFPIQLSGPLKQQQTMPDISRLPPELPEQFILREGRPGRETGAFEILSSIAMHMAPLPGDNSQETGSAMDGTNVSETEDEASSRKLLEEVQRTFVNLDEARGRCFDPRSLVEASNCLKLEFDVWQQNDASEFAMKLLDRLEISLKRWSPSVFKYLAHTFGLKTTKQKICKECGLKTSREENLMNIDCQIRNKSTIHEALSTLCEDEIMEGDNKVLCDRCKVKTNTVLRTAISALPDVLVLSLKRFDLDYTTFETVKLNSRCEFGQALNMKQYTMEAKELLEGASTEEPKSETCSMMDLGDNESNDEGSKDPLSKLPDEDYEYRLVGVLVHAGVAQGGHYYSFIKDRTSDKWYRFDDEDVTPFDPSMIEQECFGGKVKKETKFPNGHVHTVENEQFANALMLFYEKVKPVKMDGFGEGETAAGTPMDEEVDPSGRALSLTNGYDVFLPSVRKSNSTHGWQSFLLTPEFQCFINDILCRATSVLPPSHRNDVMDYGTTPETSPIESGSWRFGVVQLALSFMFDMLFHLSLERHALEKWSARIIQIFSSSPIVTEAFVYDLAKRTRCVYGNWIRAYTVECSDEPSRRTAQHIFASAIGRQLVKKNEQQLLQEWSRGWISEWHHRQVELRKGIHRLTPMPTDLTADSYAPLEDISKIGVTATAIGVILSFITLLLELSPRIVQSRVDLCFFIKLLARYDSIEGRYLRDAMAHAQLPVRLICFAWRDKFHNGIPSLNFLTSLYPGACLGSTVAVSMSKHESQNILQMGMNNTGMNGGGNQFAQTPYDVQLCVEVFACLMGMPWCVFEEITYDTGEVFRGRSVIRLTPLAIEALTAVFEESKSSAKGMSKRDIQQYMKRCGIRDIPPQRIEQILLKHAIADDKDDAKVLPLSGFLDYYQSYAVNATNDAQVTHELLMFGFRPNLTRMPPNARWHMDEATGTKQHYNLYESIAIDVASNHSLLTEMVPFIELGLWNTHFLYFTLETNRIAAQYIHAALAYGKDSNAMIVECLRTFNSAQHYWNSEISHVCRTGLALLAGIPDNKQQDRISTIMINNSNQIEGAGLLIFAQKMHQYDSNDQRDRAEKSLHMIRELRRQYAVAKWMSENRAHWAWMEPDGAPEVMNPQQSRGDYSGRRGGTNQQQSVPHSENSDDEDEYEDDEDSRFGQEMIYNEILVEGCGIPDINGVYKRCGHCDDVPKYSKTGVWDGREEDFMLFRCKLTDNTRRWYISIVPGNSKCSSLHHVLRILHDSMFEPQ
eukprot:CCRYP_002177-RC/>CCRYP_002177-RC protein AED:0.09 eAED:0.09 QI:151/1/1/1/0.8/0.83/6/655/3175